MNNNQYEYYVKQEDELATQIYTCEKALWAVQSTIYDDEERLHLGTLQRLIESILDHNLELQQDLYYIRLKKGEIARQMVGASK